MKDESISGTQIGIESFATEQETSTDLHTKYSMLIRKYNENLRTTEDLLRRIVILEQRPQQTQEC